MRGEELFLTGQNGERCVWRSCPAKVTGMGAPPPRRPPPPFAGFRSSGRPPASRAGLPRETAAGRRAWVSVAGTARGCSRWRDCGAHLGCQRLSAPDLAGHPLACSLWGRLQHRVVEQPPLALRAGGSVKPAGAFACLRRAFLYYRHKGKASAGIPFFPRRGGEAGRSPPMRGLGGVPRAELGSRLLSSDVGRTRPLCHPDNYSTMQHPLHLSHFSFPLATACPLASVLRRLLLHALGC